MPPSSSQPEQGNPKKRKAPGDRKWSTDYLLQNPKSPLVNVDLLVCNLIAFPSSLCLYVSNLKQTILKSERAWSSLSSDQQKKLVSLLPNGSDLMCKIEEQKSNVLKECLMSNSAFQSDIRMFQEDLAEGRLQPALLAKAKAAMEKRSRGDFDEWKEEETERFWGQKQRIHHKVLAGESSKVKIEDLISSGCFQVDDRWLYVRSIHKKGKGSILIEKEAKVSAPTDGYCWTWIDYKQLVSISEGSRLIFSFPPGQFKYTSSKSGSDITIECKRGPNSLAVAIVEEACNIKNWRPGNAWKEFRCLRKNQDMGSPWEIRELYYNRHGLSGGANRWLLFCSDYGT